MFGDTNLIDVKKLRNDMKNNALSAYFGGGIGPALIDVSAVERASDDEVISVC
ncbi:MAG: hypothetical protein PUI16_07420 [Clostridia bacterium]|nr:hypothetical protein [Clostridia bacterium]MDY5555605.1 hypothetical protein [Blautia sp.]